MSATASHHCKEAEVPAARIDDSVRTPFLLLFGNALHWFLVASFLSLVVSVKLVFPAFLGGISFLGFGRLESMARDLFLYGWASQAAIGAGLWLMTRICGRPLGGILMGTLINSAIVLWNLAVLLGTLAIFAGYSTGVEWLEYPAWASGLLILSFLLIAVWAVCLFDRRERSRAEASLWYLVSAFCCFPWVYGTANLLLVWKPLPGSAQAAIQGWFANGFVLLWLLPVSVAALYALLPRLSGGHLRRRNLAPLGFWLFPLFGGWSGLSLILGGPVPAWMASAGVVAGVLLLIPVAIVGLNLSGLACGVPSMAAQYLRIGLHLLFFAAVLAALTAVPGISAFARFTAITSARDLLWLLGAVSFPLFGVLYAALPGLLGRDAWCKDLSALHFWLSFSAVALLASVLMLDGLVVGLSLQDPVISFLNITSYAGPFHVIEPVGWLLLLASALVAAGNFTRALVSERLFPKN